MEYFSRLNLKKEPFSNSPDPELFYNSFQHKNCLQKLEMTIRLRRGLSVVIGDIGTGKSTLSRQLIRQVNLKDSKVVAHLLLDTEFTSPNEFLRTILHTFGISGYNDSSDWQMKEAIKNYLFKKGVDEQLITTLIFDEGQKLPSFCLEILREFLNFETNQFKLLQIIIFAQDEFKQTLKNKANFTDRIATLQYLKPLSLKETKEMIRFRINQSQADQVQNLELFSGSALFAIYLVTGGYPRRIVMLCSKIIINMLINNKKRANIYSVIFSVHETSIPFFSNRKLLYGVFLSTILIVFLLFFLSKYDLQYSNEISPTQKISQQKKPEKIKPFEVSTSTNATQLRKKNLKLPTEPSLLEEKTSMEAPQPKEENLKLPTEPSLLKENDAKVATPSIEKNLKLPGEPSLSEDQATQTASLKSEEPSSFDTIKYQPASQLLGKLPMRSGDSLSKMISRVYGQFTKRLLKEVLTINPHITSPDKIFDKTEIELPILDDVILKKNDEIIIQLASNHTILQAYHFVQKYPETAPPLQIKPLWDNKGKVSFSVFVKSSFDQQNQAEKTIISLPRGYQQDALITTASEVLGQLHDQKSPTSTTTIDPLEVLPQHSLPGKYPQASTRVLAKIDLVGLSTKELKLMRNEIFARHSYIFNNENIRKYFKDFSWYSGTQKNVKKKLSKIEVINLAFIKNYEKELQ